MATSATDVHITVAAVSQMHLPDLRHETRLVMAALLYADRVTLASPKALLASAASLGVDDRRSRLDALAELMSGLDSGQGAGAVYRDLSSRRKSLSPQERVMLSGKNIDQLGRKYG
jgi:hypothetical protein